MVRKFITKGRGSSRKVIPLKDKAVTFRVPAKVIPAYTETVSPRGITFAKMRALSDKAGLHWFSKDAMSFFNSQLHGTPHVTDKGNVYFISSERYETDPRKYTIRQFNPAKGSVDDVSGFQAYGTLESAKSDMAKLE